MDKARWKPPRWLRKAWETWGHISSARDLLGLLYSLATNYGATALGVVAAMTSWFSHGSLAMAIVAGAIAAMFGQVLVLAITNRALDRGVPHPWLRIGILTLLCIVTWGVTVWRARQPPVDRPFEAVAATPPAPHPSTLPPTSTTVHRATTSTAASTTTTSTFLPFTIGELVGAIDLTPQAIMEAIRAAAPKDRPGTAQVYLGTFVGGTLPFIASIKVPGDNYQVVLAIRDAHGRSLGTLTAVVPRAKHPELPYAAIGDEVTVAGHISRIEETMELKDAMLIVRQAAKAKQ